MFTGSILLSGSGNGGGLFDFDGDGICTFIGPGRVNASSMGTYCSSAASNGSDPADYQGPDNTFSNISTKSVFDDTGDVNITGLAAGGTTFFSLESAPASITIAPPVISSTPEPSSLVLLSSGLLGAAATLRRRFAV
ncbi:MAG TPA: PEP-CTERM sorting domain-containing protein [Acidobacteriaceae bacterium]|nr:PEP-CTERM sorting domain-containing protein [Acidobacteriaceae bacterium]